MLFLNISLYFSGAYFITYSLRTFKSLPCFSYTSTFENEIYSFPFKISASIAQSYTAFNLHKSSNRSLRYDRYSLSLSSNPEENETYFFSTSLRDSSSKISKRAIFEPLKSESILYKLLSVFLSTPKSVAISEFLFFFPMLLFFNI